MINLFGGPGMSDFHAFTSSSGGDSDSPQPGCFSWIATAIVILWILEKLFG